MLARGYTGQLRVLSPPPLTWNAILWGALPLAVLAIIEILAVLWWR
jgi:TRAP-type mannitol/chloroaromatic compound transport system permease large subunit